MKQFEDFPQAFMRYLLLNFEVFKKKSCYYFSFQKFEYHAKMKRKQGLRLILENTSGSIFLFNCFF